MRASILGVTLGLCVSGLIGCDDNGTNDKPDAAPPVDAGPTFKGFNADEGGEVRIEYVRNAKGENGTRALAFLYKNAGTTKYFPFIDLHGCTDMTNPVNWPMATNPLSERTYLDPGTITISADGATPLVVPKSQNAKDFLNRQHTPDKWNFYFNGLDGATYLPQKAAYDVTFSGSADMPAQTFKDVLYMPADFALTAPGSTPVAIPAGTDATFTWATPANGEPTGYEVQSLVAFTGPNGPAILCVEPNDGSITVPAKMVDIARTKYPMGGTLARQTLTHVTRELVDSTGPTGKRIDFLSVWCYATSFTVP